jgi:Small nuclear RNA activating complex subunit 2-like.
MSDICIPQVLTVSALEPINLRAEIQAETAAASGSTESQDSTPNYKNIYNYLSAITRGSDAPPLSPVESAVVLDLLENLILTLSKSQTLIQREHLHSNYNELRKYLNLPTTEDGGTASPKKKFSSTNPFGIPFEILNFKMLEQCAEHAEQKDSSTETHAKSPSKSKNSVNNSSEAPSKMSQLQTSSSSKAPKVIYYMPSNSTNPNSEPAVVKK